MSMVYLGIVSSAVATGLDFQLLMVRWLLLQSATILDVIGVSSDRFRRFIL